MATPIARRPEPGGESSMVVPVNSAVTEYLLPATRRGIAAQVAGALGILTGLWIAISPLFIALQHGGNNLATANVIAGLTAAGVGVFAVASPRGFPGLLSASAVLGVWVLISSFILAAKYTVATPAYWSNSFSGAALAVVALAGLATLRRVSR